MVADILVDRRLQESGLGPIYCKKWEKARTRNDVEGLKIPLPPLPVQRRIVEILEKADEVRRKRRLADERTSQILQVAFVKMFGDPVRNEMGWEMMKLEEITLFSQYGLNKSAKENGVGIPYIRITDINDEGELNLKATVDTTDEELKKYQLVDGDILFARSGATVDKTYIYQDIGRPCLFASYLIRFRPDKKKVLPEFLRGFFMTQSYKGFVGSVRHTVAQPNINAKEYGSLKIPLPPIELQQRFTNFTKQVDAIKRKHMNLKENVESTFQALMQKAFRGELVA